MFAHPLCYMIVTPTQQLQVMKLILICTLLEIALACVWNDKTYSDGETPTQFSLAVTTALKELTMYATRYVVSLDLVLGLLHLWTSKVAFQERKIDGSFKLKCTFGSRGGWSTSIIACVTPKGTEVAVDSQLNEDDVVYTCSKGSSEGSVNFNFKLSQ
ncbi:unnamed protein product [Haemonchus placei]|uniref:Ig-like domain-containing protein n=1 Tax=Haemonchus placei TaxID=6290 RepID=A0A0N4WSN0_HAEPC|nr:unnamed protein product [Haemonchus placei]